MDHKARLVRLRENLRIKGVDALLVTHLPNVRYLCGFTGSAGALLVSERESVFFTDARYAQQSRAEVQSSNIRIVRGPLLAAVAAWAIRAKIQKIGIEASHLTIAERNVLKKNLPACKLVESVGLVEQLRLVKDSDEAAKIRAACHLGVQLFGRLLKTMRSGVSELEVAGQLEFAAKRAGAQEMSFPTIVAGGKRSALPHGRASEALLPPRGFVVCDFGVILAGYCSDMTRTIHLERPQSKGRRVYEAVHEAQQAALDLVRPGITVGEVDRVARNSLKKKALSRHFTHSTGHGVGLEIHESPRIAAGEKQVLETGMVITVEPGVYIPGEFGVRIEDTVLVTDTGCEILTPCSKELITL